MGLLCFPMFLSTTSFSNSIFSWTSGEEANTISPPFTRKGEIKQISDYLIYQGPGTRMDMGCSNCSTVG